MEDVNYTYEKLMVAVSTLTGPGDIRARLLDAFISALHVLGSNDFPEELRDDWLEIMQALTWLPAERDEGTAQRTVEAMSDDEAREVASQVFSLFLQVAERYCRAEES